MASPLSLAMRLMKALDGLIFIRSVHQRNLSRGAGYPLPMRLTQKVSSTSGVRRCGWTGNPDSEAAARMVASDFSTQAATMGFSTRVSVLMTWTGLVRCATSRPARAIQTSWRVAVESLPPL